MDLRLRAGANWSLAAWGASITLNYSDGYRNNLVEPSGAVDAWLTTDMQLRYATNTISVALNVQNVTNEAPPSVSGSGDVWAPVSVMAAHLVAEFDAVRIREHPIDHDDREEEPMHSGPRLGRRCDPCEP